MPRVSIEVAAERRARVHELRAQGLSLREISAQTGLCLASVRNFLARDLGDSRVDELRAAVAIKAANPDLSSREIKDRYALGVGEATIQRRFADAGLSLPRGRRSLGLRRYWMDEKPSTYLDMIQIDTVKLRDAGGVLHEYLSARDVFSGAHVLLPHDQSESGMLRNVQRLFAIFGGVPRVVQADNGTTDFSMPRRNRLRPWMQWAFAAGVRRIQFIPEAEPQRNGAVESFHSWIKQRMDHEYVSGDLDKFLRDKLLYYNHIRSLSTTRKTPASRAPNFCLDRESLGVVEFDESRWSRGECCVSFVRLALRDRESRAVVAVVRSPGTVYVLPDEFEGSYVRLDVYATRGELWMPVTVAGEVGRVDGRLQAGAAGALAGSFDSPFVNDLPVVPVSVTDVPVDTQVVDASAVVRRWARVLKQACPTLLPSGYETRVDDSGWEVWYRGELVWTEQSSPETIDHAKEAL